MRKLQNDDTCSNDEILVLMDGKQCWETKFSLTLIKLIWSQSATVTCRDHSDYARVTKYDYINRKMLLTTARLWRDLYGHIRDFVRGVLIRR